jgi:hypothetical protein
VTYAVFLPTTPSSRGATQALSSEQLDKSTIASEDSGLKITRGRRAFIELQGLRVNALQSPPRRDAQPRARSPLSSANCLKAEVACEVEQNCADRSRSTDDEDCCPRR